MPLLTHRQGARSSEAAVQVVSERVRTGATPSPVPGPSFSLSLFVPSRDAPQLITACGTVLQSTPPVTFIRVDPASSATSAPTPTSCRASLLRWIGKWAWYRRTRRGRMQVARSEGDGIDDLVHLCVLSFTPGKTRRRPKSKHKRKRRQQRLGTPYHLWTQHKPHRSPPTARLLLQAVCPACLAACPPLSLVALLPRQPLVYHRPVPVQTSQPSMPRIWQ